MRRLFSRAFWYVLAVALVGWYGGAIAGVAGVLWAWLLISAAVGAVAAVAARPWTMATTERCGHCRRELIDGETAECIPFCAPGWRRQVLRDGAPDPVEATKEG